MREHGIAPPKIAGAPELQPGLDLYYRAFWVLDSCRAPGFGASGRIPWTAIDRYSTRHELTGEQRVDMEHHVDKLDLTLLKFQSDKAEAKRRAMTGKGGGKK